MNDSKRTHEVRVGMSVYWVKTWPGEERWGGGHYFALADGVEHWISGTRLDALENAKRCLRARAPHQSGDTHG